MQNAIAANARSEPEFAALIEALCADPARRDQLSELLRESHPVYDGRGTAAIVRMRGWVLLALARGEVPDAALIFVLGSSTPGSMPILLPQPLERCGLTRARPRLSLRS